MEKTYPHLFSPITIGGVTFRNRIFSSPGGTHGMQCGETYPTEATMEHYARKARGGAASINFTGFNFDVDRPIKGSHVSSECLDIRDEYAAKRYLKLTDRIHSHGARCAFEFQHMGHGWYTPADVAAGYQPYAPSAFVRADGVQVAEMTEEQILRLCRICADAAENVMLAGFDTLFIHGGHSMLLNQFMSPIDNHRTDAYGGSLENRARFPLLLLDMIRDRVGDKLLIEYRVSGTETNPAGYDVSGCIDFIKLIQDRIDIIQVSTGINPPLPGSKSYVMGTGFYGETPFVDLARAVRADPGIKVPVAAVGGIHQPATAEKLIAEGWCDIVTTVRGLISDPDMPNKALEGRDEDITPCIRCMYCTDGHYQTRRFTCSVNPRAGRELYTPDPIRPAETTGKVVVAGGGPAGMMAALTAAKRGHSVVLLEQNDHLGGQLVFAEKAAFKHDLFRYMNHLITQVSKHPGIEVRLNTKATPELVEREAPRGVIAALGAQPVLPPIPGINGANVMPAAAAYVDTDSVGHKVVIVGGGLVGCETALYLAQAGRDVTILEMAPVLAGDSMPTYKDGLMHALLPVTRQLTGCRCTGIAESRVTYADEQGSEGTLEADTVIIAAGMRARSADAESFRETGLRYAAVGDCVKPKNVHDAIRTAYDVGLNI